MESFWRNVEEEQGVQRVPSRVVSLDDFSQRMSQLSVRSPLRTATLQVRKGKDGEKQARAINTRGTRYEDNDLSCVISEYPGTSPKEDFFFKKKKQYLLVEFQPPDAIDHRCLPPRWARRNRTPKSV